jgi:hypothetical protein
MFSEGYRYPPLTGQYTRLPYQTKYGVIEKTIQVPSKKWAAYFLNKKAVAGNEWVKF